jgi:hypothetical protein
MFLVYTISSTYFSTIDLDTLRPKKDEMNADLLRFSKWSNYYIKFGFMHLSLYALEFFRTSKSSPLNKNNKNTNDIFEFHIGQRLTTLWYQFFQNERYGQHLHMQIETALQICDDLFINKTAFPTTIERLYLYFIGFLMLFTNAVTSSGFHTFEEQTYGFIYCIVKLIYDYSNVGLIVNKQIGSTLSNLVQIVAGFIFVGIGILFNELQMLHPTVIATLFLLGGLVTGLVIKFYLQRRT